MYPLTVEMAAEKIVVKRRQDSSHQSLLVGVSGIDGSGKGYVTNRIIERLNATELKAIGINIDGWLNLPERRFNDRNLAEHFYNHAIRFDEMFSRLILPLKRNRSVDIIADFAEETATEYRKHRYQYTEMDIIVLEGIYLFKKAFREYYDVAIWIDCTFETALERAVARSQEELSKSETVQAYQRIYFPAQQLHFRIDEPCACADFVVPNDHRLATLD